MKKSKKFFSILEKILFWLGTPAAFIKTGALIKTSIVEETSDKSNENTVGYENIGIKYNTVVHTNNFVILHVSTSDFNDISAVKAKLEKCDELDISVGLILDTKAYDLAQIYKDVDYLQAIVKDYKIDLPVYCNIDGVMENKNLNNAQRKEIIEAFVSKAERSDMYLGMYGKDSNLVDCNRFIYDLSNYDCFLVQDSSTIKFDGTYTIHKDLQGNITAKEDLSNIIIKNGLNSSHKLVYSSSYRVQLGDTYHSLALQFGLSENDLISYNNGKSELNVGDVILIPNLYKTVDTVSNNVTYSYAVARGIDISDYQVDIDWDRVKETSDYVIVEVAREPRNYIDNIGSYIEECTNQIINVVNNDISLGLYFCISSDMKVSVYEERLDEYFSILNTEMKDNGVELNRGNIPVFLDFEEYYSGNDYYRLMEVFEQKCLENGFSKVGIYGNGHTLSLINDSLVKNGEHIDLNDTNWYVWKSGGPQYSTNEKLSYDDVTLDELVEVECSLENGYTPVMKQVTNVCIDTGASNDMQHCDVSFLYDYSVFGDDFVDKVDSEYVSGTIEIDLSNYPNLPVSNALNYVDLVLSCAYIIVAVKIVGRKLFVGLKNKNSVKKLAK